MPEIQPSSIVSFSSEAKEYPAANLLKPSGFNKWKCAKPGEKNAIVEFQLPCAERINQIDIGNEGSAFVEVLVRRSSATNEDYQVILPSSSFMSPVEARSRSGQNRVRLFKTDRLARAVAEQKWDRVRVVCSQPFARTETYGLAFIRFYSVESDAEAEAASSSVKKTSTLAGFVIRDEAGDSSSKGPSLSLFSKKKDKSDEEDDEIAEPGPSSIATQIRSASKVAETELAKSREEKASKPATAAATGVRKRLSQDSESSDKPASKKAKIKRESSSESKSSGSSKKAPVAKKKPEVQPFKSLMRGVIFCLSGFENPLRSQLRDKAQAMGAVYRASWSRDCTHLICAFENTPKYKEVSGKGRIVVAKWIEQCHRRRELLPWRDFRLGRAASPPGSDGEARKRRAASSRAPVRDVSSEEEEEDEEEEEEEVLPRRKGRAAPPAKRHANVSSEEAGGTSDSDSEAELQRLKKERLNRKRKRRNSDDSEEEWRPSKGASKEESDSEPDAEIEEESSVEGSSDEEKGTRKKKSPPVPKKKRAVRKEEEEEEEEEEVMPAKKNRATPSPAKTVTAPEKSKKVSLLDGSDSDSNGGWAPVRRKKAGSPEKKNSRTPSPSKAKARRDSEEEEEEEGKKKKASPTSEAKFGELPDLFLDTTFFFYGSFLDDTERLLRRMIVAYGGVVAPYMSENVKYVITASKWDDNFDDALAENSGLQFVKPQWLFECDQRRKFVPYQKYQVVAC